MIAITGATGLLGQHIIERFKTDGTNPIALYRGDHDALLPKDIIKRQADIWIRSH